MATPIQDFIPGSKFDNDQLNHSLGTMKALSVSTQRRAGGGTTRSHHQAPLPRDGNRLRGGNLLHGRRHQDRVSDDCFSLSQGVSLAGNGDSRLSDGGVNTTLNPRTRRTPAHVIFLVWLKT